MAKSTESKHVLQQKLWLGISNLLKEPSSQDPDAPTNFYYSENIDIRTDPYAPRLNAATVKESGSVIQDFVKWCDITPASLTVYEYGDTGNLYSRTTAGVHTFLHQAAASHGNGLQYFYGDDYLYYPCDSTIGRYGPLSSSSPTFSDDFLKAQGGVPLNTASILLASASSMYGHAADSASLDITGNLTLETYFKANSLPTVGNSMTLLGKWDESGATRCYKLDLYGVSGFFGSGADGSLTISSNTTEAPIDSACTGTSGTQTLSATNSSFAVGQVIFIHQSQGTNAGQGERNTIQGYTAGTITLATPLKNTYTTGAQVRTLPQYTNVTVNSGITYTAKAWNGTTGGILAFLANGTVSGGGNISAVGRGFRGGASATGAQSTTFAQGEGESGTGSNSNSANGEGGGGGSSDNGNRTGGGGGGGYGTTGTAGGSSGGGPPPANGGNGGGTNGSTDLTTMLFGGGGGAGAGQLGSNSNAGAAGGGIIFINAVTLTVTGTINANGGNGTLGSSTAYASSGGGAGGSVLLKVQTATLGTNLVTASGGTGGGAVDSNTGTGGNGGNGRLDINYLTSVTGTTTPTINEIQDNTLVTTTTIQARLGISNDGTAFEYLTQNLNGLATGVWNRLSVAWTASTSTAQFYMNAVSIGSSVGTKTAIANTVALLYVGANKNATVIANYFDGLLNDMRIWANVQTSSQIYVNNQLQVATNAAGLAAYYKFNSAATDSTSNVNNLTLVNTPTYSSDVPFPMPTTRLDIDQSFTTTGQTYSLLTSISENAADTLTFTPADDPQKSVDFNIAAKGTGAWTVTVHDVQNKVVATQTITNANLQAAGYQEFIFATPWRIVIGKTYHMHLTSTVADGTVVTGTTNLFSTADFHTYFGFLVTDTLFHPSIRWLNFLVVGNERYLAKWDGAFYSPNLIAFPQGTHVRCYGVWGIYLAIGTWQERTDGTAPNVYDFATGKIYFWDGISLTFNFSIDVPEGQVNSIFGMDSNLYYYAGFRGDLMQYTGTWMNQSGSFNGTKIKRIPYLSAGDYMEVYPQAIANYQGLLYMGLAGNTNSTTLPQGVYSWGALYPQYPQTLSFDHIISTENKSNIKIGVVYPVQQKLLVSWKDGSGYGVDVIDPTAGTFHTSGKIQTNLFDNTDLYHPAVILKSRAEHSKLATGETVTVGYALDRATTYETSTSITDTLSKFTSNTASDGRAREFQLQVQLAGNGSTSPTLLALSASIDALSSEEAY